MVDRIVIQLKHNMNAVRHVETNELRKTTVAEKKRRMKGIDRFCE